MGPGVTLSGKGAAMAMAGSAPIIIWFHRDLRLDDNPALFQAYKMGAPVVGLFIWDDDPSNAWTLGGAQKWWLHHSLHQFKAACAVIGLPLILQHGPALDIVPNLVKAIAAQRVFWNRRYEPALIRRDTAIKDKLRHMGILAESFNANLLFEPWTILTQDQGPFRVFTPFWRACQKVTPPEPLPPPPPRPMMPVAIAGDRLTDWTLLPANPDWSTKFSSVWQPGEAGARRRWEEFVTHRLVHYAAQRDHPEPDQVSRLSPHLHFGEISPRRLWHDLQIVALSGGAHAEAFRRQLGWREFSYHLLYHFPDLPQENFRQSFNRFPWQPDEGMLRAWQKGRTGYPLVDAGMRQLWRTGWMHNRVRMVAASFLVKHLLQDWRLGARWFWDTLVDADLASNSASWQWVAGSGADAAPYFRIFNPVLQGEKFDPHGHYVRKWVPELADLYDRYIHQPWAAPESQRVQAGIHLGHTYPVRVIDHDQARARALAAFATLNV